MEGAVSMAVLVREAAGEIARMVRESGRPLSPKADAIICGFEQFAAGEISIEELAAWVNSVTATG